MSLRWVLKGGVAVCLIAAVTCGIAGTVLSQTARPMVRFGTVGLDGTYYLPIIMAMQKGYFEQQGIQTEAVQIGPDDNLVRAVAAGALPIGIPEVSIAVNGNAHGAPVAVIAGLLDRYPYDLTVKPAIKTYADLRGKTLAHWTVAPEVSTTLIRRLLESHGLKEGDYNIIAGGNMPTRYAALTRGAVDGAILTVPYNLVARKDGFTILGGLYDIPAVFAGVITNTNWAEKNRPLVVAWLKAAILGFRYVTDPAHRDEVVKVMADRTKIDPAIVGTTYDQLYRQQAYLVSWQLVPSQRSMQGVLDILASIGQIPQSTGTGRYFQLTYLNQALQELGR
jgi:ABC-type nitrate/sulfonate/bicarbonate transport system substrate-binding protein